MRFFPRVLVCVLVTSCSSPDQGADSETDASATGSTVGTATDVASTTTTGSSSTSGSESGEEESGSSSSSTGPAPDTNADACEGATFRAKPNDASLRGPWAVGASTVTIDDMTVEVFYPAMPGSETGLEPIVYDIREALPEAEALKITDDINPPLPCDCYRDLPVDDAFGPYPAIVFIHGTAGFRTQSLRHLTHWASRGFVVVAADHPGLQLGDLLGLAPGCSEEPPPSQDLPGDLVALFGAIRGDTPELAAFESVVDASRIGTVGHSAGGNAVGSTSADAQVIIPLAARPEIAGGATLQQTLNVGGLADTVVDFAATREAYDVSVSPKRLVGIEGAGHLAPSEICSITNADGDSMLDVAQAVDVCGAQFAGALFQCSPDLTPDPQGWEIIEYATASAFEEVLHCSAVGTENLEQIRERFPLVMEYRAE